MKAMEKAAKTDSDIATRVELFRYRFPEEFYDLKNDPGKTLPRLYKIYPAMKKCDEGKTQARSRAESSGSTSQIGEERAVNKRFCFNLFFLYCMFE